jgi:hypothetical protein
MRCGVKVSAYVVFQFKINHIKAFKGFLNKAHFPIKIFQKKKKEKKESTDVKWRVSKKQVFFKKYYHPDSSLG